MAPLLLSSPPPCLFKAMNVNVKYPDKVIVTSVALVETWWSYIVLRRHHRSRLIDICLWPTSDQDIAFRTLFVTVKVASMKFVTMGLTCFELYFSMTKSKPFALGKKSGHGPDKI